MSTYSEFTIEKPNKIKLFFKSMKILRTVNNVFTFTASTNFILIEATSRDGSRISTMFRNNSTFFKRFYCTNSFKIELNHKFIKKVVKLPNNEVKFVWISIVPIPNKSQAKIKIMASQKRNCSYMKDTVQLSEAHLNPKTYDFSEGSIFFSLENKKLKQIITQFHPMKNLTFQFYKNHIVIQETIGISMKLKEKATICEIYNWEKVSITKENNLYPVSISIHREALSYLTALGTNSDYANV